VVATGGETTHKEGFMAHLRAAGATGASRPWRGCPAQLLLPSLLAGCVLQTAGDETAPVAPEESAIDGFAAIAQRNGIVNFDFRPFVITPDGLLGIAWDATTGLPSFLALKRMRGAVVDGRPSTQSPDAGQAPFVHPVVYDSLFDGPTVDMPHPFLATLPANAAGQAWIALGQGMLTIDPRYAPSGKPFRVAAPTDCENATPATVTQVSSPAGRYDCYRLIHLAPRLHLAVNAPVAYQALLTVVVDANVATPTGVQRGPAPQVVSVRYDTRYQLATSTQGHWAHALELSATSDGRLAVSDRGFLLFNETPWNPATWTPAIPVHSLYQQVQQDAHGMARICRHLDAGGSPGCTDAQLEPFASVYPLAAHPIYLADGRRPLVNDAASSELTCGYPWITPEGTDLFCRIDPDDAGDDLALPVQSESSTGIQFFVMGEHTGWLAQRVDTGAHLKRVVNPVEVTNRAFSLAFLGNGSGFWADRDTPENEALPFLRRSNTFQFLVHQEPLGSTNPISGQLAAAGLLPAAGGLTQYTEVNLSPGVEPATLLHLPMNEMFYDGAVFQSSQLVRGRPLLADVSANLVFADGAPAQVYPYRAELQGDAAFAADRRPVDADAWYLAGFRGTGVVFGPGGLATVRTDVAESPCQRSKGCLSERTFDGGFTAEIAVLPHVDPAAIASLPLAEHRGLWQLSLNAGRPQARLTAGATTLELTAPAAVGFADFASSLAVQAPLWTHVALRVSQRRNDGTRSVELLVNGAVVQAGTVPASRPLRATAIDGHFLTVGPGNAAGLTGLVSMDEFAFHAEARGDRDLRASAAASTALSQDWLPADQARAHRGLVPGRQPAGAAARQRRLSARPRSRGAAHPGRVRQLRDRPGALRDPGAARFPPVQHPGAGAAQRWRHQPAGRHRPADELCHLPRSGRRLRRGPAARGRPPADAPQHPDPRQPGARHPAVLRPPRPGPPAPGAHADREPGRDRRLPVPGARRSQQRPGDVTAAVPGRLRQQRTVGPAAHRPGPGRLRPGADRDRGRCDALDHRQPAGHRRAGDRAPAGRRAAGPRAVLRQGALCRLPRRPELLRRARSRHRRRRDPGRHQDPYPVGDRPHRPLLPRRLTGNPRGGGRLLHARRHPRRTQRRRPPAPRPGAAAAAALGQRAGRPGAVPAHLAQQPGPDPGAVSGAHGGRLVAPAPPGPVGGPGAPGRRLRRAP
jgi:hypothetical protein